MKRLRSYRPTRADAPELIMVALGGAAVVALVVRIFGGAL